MELTGVCLFFVRFGDFMNWNDRSMQIQRNKKKAEKVRLTLIDDIEAFLANGGKITLCPVSNQKHKNVFTVSYRLSEMRVVEL